MPSQQKSTECVVTVFLAVSFVLIMSLILALVESAHVSAVRYQVTLAADAAADSLFSNYHNELWDRYKLILYEMKDKGEAESMMAEYMRPYAEAENWYRFSPGIPEIIRADPVTCSGGELFEQEILDYMDYAVVAELVEKFGKGDAEKLWDDLREAGSMKEMTDDYAEESEKAVDMEKALERVSSNLESQRTECSAAESAWETGNWSSFRSHAGFLKTHIRNLTGRIEDYSSKADRLSLELDECEIRNAARMAELRPDSREYMDETVRKYREYADGDSRRRIEIESLDDRTEYNLDFIDGLIEDSYRLEAEEAAAEAEEEAERAAAEAAGEEYTGGSEFSIPPCEIGRVYIGRMNCSFGIKDEETEQALDAAKNVLSAGILQLVLPEGKTVSEQSFDLSGLPSHTCVEPRDTADRNVMESLLIDEYACRVMRDFTDIGSDTSGAAGDAGKKTVGTVSGAGCPSYELEYVLAGESSDSRNLAAAAERVYAIREGMNYLHIVRDAQKRNEVKALATAIVGGLGLPVLIPVLECLIIGVWAGVESVIDMRALLSGKKVSLFKSASEWKTGLTGMVSQLKSTGGGNLVTGDTSGDQRGIAYETYLKFIMLLLGSEERNYRMMDVIQLNISQNDDSFRLADCIYGMEAGISCMGKGIFTGIPAYDIRLETKKAY